MMVDTLTGTLDILMLALRGRDYNPDTNNVEYWLRKLNAATKTLQALVKPKAMPSTQEVNND